MEIGTRAGIEADETVLQRVRTGFGGWIHVHEPDREASARVLAALHKQPRVVAASGIYG